MVQQHQAPIGARGRQGVKADRVSVARALQWVLVGFFCRSLLEPLLGNSLSLPIAPSATPNEEGDRYLTDGEAVFLEEATSLELVTDKVTVHTYQTMYGQYLLPYYRKNPKMKMLEIGLGCHMEYGPGASVALYRKLFPLADLWEGEYSPQCVTANRNTTLAGLNLLIGDQGDPKVLDQWIRQSGGNFDVVIDDGGHTNCQIWTSFQKLWPTVKSGGLYFIEDMQVAKVEQYRKSTPTCDGTNLNVPDKLKDFIDTMIYDIDRKGDIKFIFCQSEACVLGKK